MGSVVIFLSTIEALLSSKIQALLSVENDDGEALVGVGCSVFISEHSCTQKHLGVMQVLYLSLSPDRMPWLELPLIWIPFCSPRSISLGNISECKSVGPEERRAPSSICPTQGTCAGQDIRKGRERASRGSAKWTCEFSGGLCVLASFKLVALNTWDGSNWHL